MKNTGELKLFLSELMESIQMENSGINKKYISVEVEFDEFEQEYESDDEDDL